ncbi:MAG: alpha/beta hydrolase [Cyclobacteriaceae bacterium]
MKKKITNIDAGEIDRARPADRPPKSNWKLEMIKKSLRMVQHVSPNTASKVIWHFFTKPNRSKVTDNQQLLINKAKISASTYNGVKIMTYQWGDSGPKVLLSHGWNSKILDFRRMIESLLDQGYQVEGIDMKGHGLSDGKHTALPEFRDILKSHYLANGEYDTVIGYSYGGIAAGLMLSELPTSIQPKNLFLIASPPYVNYFLKDIINDVGCNERVYSSFCRLFEKQFKEEVGYFDLRNKNEKLNAMNLHLIYDEHDETVKYERGEELQNALSDAHFVHTKGLGHYKIITHYEVIDYVIGNMKKDISAIIG